MDVFDYFTEQEYQNAFSEFEGIRRSIAGLLRKAGDGEVSRILDLLAGHGYLSAELAGMFPESQVVATGLRNDLESFQSLRESKRFPELIWERVRFVETDVTSMNFDDDSFDLVANFLGLEDVMMTRGKAGLSSTIAEVSRVARPEALVEITVVEYGDAPEERLAKEVWEDIGLNAVFLDREFYVNEFEKNELEAIEERVFQVRKKMTLGQAEEELRFACEEAPRIFAEYNVLSVPFDGLMKRYRERIRHHGMAYYPNIRAILFRRSS